MKADIVIDLSFGDGGKGITTDYLCSNYDPSSVIVVRFSGGHQAGHKVVLGDKSHVFSSFGSGSLRGCSSYFTEHTCLYLNTIAVEREVLESLGLQPKLYLHPHCKMTTPYDVAYNQWTERQNRHGSVGLGIGTTMKRNLNTGYLLHALDMFYPEVAKKKIEAIKNYYVSIESSKEFYDLFAEPEQQFLSLLDEKHFNIRNYDFLKDYDHLVFEGSQGVLLDMDHGFFPHVTFASTTSRNAMAVCRKLKIKPELYYVTRCYQTRHGNGWMSNEGKPVTLINNEGECNVSCKWQGEFRTAEIDYNMLNYALDVDNIYSEGLLKNLVVTCLDQRPDFQFHYDDLGVNFRRVFTSHSPDSKDIKRNKNYFA